MKLTSYLPLSLDPHSDFNERVCFSPVLVYLFVLLAFIAQLLLMFFCTWILFNTLKRKSYHQTRVNSRTSSQLTSDAQSIYSLRTGNETLRNYYTNSNFVNSIDELDCLGLNDLSNDEDLNKLKCGKYAGHLWPIKINNKSCTSSSLSKPYSSSSLVTMFKQPDDFFNKDICIS